MSKSTPVAILAVLGAVIAVLGLFVASNIVMVGVGLVAVFGAGLLDVLAIRSAPSMTGAYAALGILLAIPFGLMLAPLAVGVIVLVLALRRMDRAVGLEDPSASASA